MSKMTPQILKMTVDVHEKYWREQRKHLYNYKQAYETDFWEDSETYGLGDYGITIQTADAYGYIESYIASLFSRNPGVVFKDGLRKRGNKDIAEHLANDFLVRQRTVIENASRMALIYPMAFAKLMPRQSDDIYRRVDMFAIPPWEVVVDRQARRWQDCRYVGHKYFLPLDEAKELFGNKQYEPQRKEEYFEREYNNQEDPSVDTEMFQFIEVVEMYDLQNNMMHFWSPNWQHGDKYLMSSEIPFENASREAVIPIVPLYFNRIPDNPLDGYSAMKRIYDQIYESNLIRTFQANAVRKASRQYLIRKGALDEEQMAQIASGVDGLFVEVDDENINNCVVPLPQNQTPPELEQYYRQVQMDKDKGNILAPFTRGEATRSTATEIAALASYSSNEIGRLARERDMMIEQLATTYISILSLYLEESGEKDVVYIDGVPEVVIPTDLKENWVCYAQDQAMTPISESIRKREYIQSIPVLQQLGVPPDTLLKELVRALGLPEAFFEEAQKAKEAATKAAAQQASQAVPPDAASLAQESIPMGPNNLQSIIKSV
jgi:hypothetical protein